MGRGFIRSGFYQQRLDEGQEVVRTEWDSLERLEPLLRARE